MEGIPILPPNTPRKILASILHPGYGSEDRTAEFHSPFDHSSSIMANDPLCSFLGKLRGRWGRRVKQGDLIEPQTDFCVGGTRELVEFPKVLYMGGRKCRIRL